MHKFTFTQWALLLFSIFPVFSFAQIDSVFFQRVKPNETIGETLNMDATYNRPMLSLGNSSIALGGYMETNWQHLGEEGISDGHQFQFRRLSIFLSSTISERIKFLSEIEFEPADNEIKIEFAAVDIEFSPWLNFRGGIIVNPIGAFNQNHDGPKWEFIDRPISATQLLPATWSNAGFGFYGKKYNKNWMLGYEIYASSGFDGQIINNEQSKTYLPASKSNNERFEISASGEPLYTGKIAIRNQKIGELGLSYMTGAYNAFEQDGETVDDRRSLNVFAVDFNTTLPKLNTFITGEWAWIQVDVPENYTQHYGNKQHGGFLDIIQPIVQGKMLGWDKAVFNLAARIEYVDWNTEKLKETGEKIGDDTWSVVGGLGFRPNAQTVLRLNYRHQRSRDFLANPATQLGGWSLGLATYF